MLAGQLVLGFLLGAGEGVVADIEDEGDGKEEDEGDEEGEEGPEAGIIFF